MKNKTLLFLLSIALLFAYTRNDYDCDGVDDIYDKCPNSLLSDIVDNDGCRIASTKDKYNLNIILGEKLVKSDEYENIINALE